MELGTVEDTLFVPLLGRIYASKNHSNILFDAKALELERKIPERIRDNDRQKQYTLIASASRSANMDRYIDAFLSENPEGVIVELGVGLESTFYRKKKTPKAWYGVDLDNVITYRKNLLGEEGIKLISGDAFSEAWIKAVKNENPASKILVTCSGLFYYFSNEKVCSLLKKLHEAGDFQIVFDAVNKSGMKMMKKAYMKQVGHADAEVFFYVDKGNSLVKEIGNGCALLSEEPFYKHIDRRGLKAGTKFNMVASDILKMVKMIHLSL
ncbi:MAG: class I SAM-dependent methyltransferase [Bacillota bacterium]|nr:class I SAM-dependent methyltransferase [Bacillota bacterium]